MTVSGCAGLGGGGTAETFYPEYYAAKRLENADIIKLRGFMASSDDRVSAPATLLLGINYLRHGDKNFGRLLIEKSYGSSYLDPQMRIFGLLWKMEALLSENDEAGAEKIKNKILSLDRDDTYIRTLKIYCLNVGRTLKAGEDPSVCAEEKFKMPVSDFTEIVPEASSQTEEGVWSPADNITETGTEGMTYEEYLKAMGIGGAEAPAALPEPEAAVGKNTEINVTGGDVMSEMVQGMIFAISDLKTSFTVNSVSKEAAADMDEDAIVVALGRAEIKVGGQVVAFGTDWSGLVLTAASLKSNEGIGRVVICAPNSKIGYAKYMAEQYDPLKVKTRVLNYDNPSFQSQLRGFLEGEGNENVLMAGIGSEEEIINFIPVAKFLQNGKNQKIMLIVSSLSGTNLKNEYGRYFRDVYVLTPVQLVNNKKFGEINLGYEAFFGNPMNLSNILGYDAVVYLNSLTEPAYGDRFLSNISGFVDGAAYRNIGLYKIGRKLDVTEIKYEIVKPRQEEAAGTETE